MKFFAEYRFQSILIVMLGVAFLSIIFFTLAKTNEDYTTRMLVQSARSYSATFSGIRNFYQSEIVSRVSGSDVLVTHDFRSHEKAIPIPATMMLELSSFLNKEASDVTFALVSDYPFPWRKGRLLTEFDTRALQALREDKVSEYFEIFDENNTIYLHYASPVLMKKGCVECHNTHPDSPKRDWKVGDIRAAQIFEIPVTDTLQSLDLETSVVASAITLFGVTVICTLLFLNMRASRAQSLLRREAYYDILTGAMRRQRFQEIYDTKERTKDYYIILIDIDDFKMFNTNFGHVVGDYVLAATVANIRTAIPQAEVMCRFGGEEFVLLVPVSEVSIEPLEFLNNAIAAVSQASIDVKERSLRCTISAGFAVLRRDDDLIKAAEKADTALRYAKRMGKNRAIEADTQLLSQLGFNENNFTLTDIVSAIKRNEFTFAYQKIVDIKTNRPIAYEALVRWRAKDGEPMPPGSYLPQYLSALRDTTLVEDIRKMVRQSLPPRTAADGNPLHLSFNYDPHDIISGFENNALTPVLRELVDDGYKISIEVTETPYVQGESTATHFSKLAAYGFDLHLDDFGKDGSGIERLAALSFAMVKCDRSLIKDLETSERRQQMISLMVQVVESVGAQLVVEGVESDAQRQILEKLGVKYAQGYLFGRPEFFASSA
jgi:diguanylate cyclase (GGDEF)-like protein